MLQFIGKGRTDFMGFRWYYVYENGSPLMKQNTHLAYNALSADHARAIHNQLSNIK